jgi:hypothetical protein
MGSRWVRWRLQDGEEGRDGDKEGGERERGGGRRERRREAHLPVFSNTSSLNYLEISLLISLFHCSSNTPSQNA